MNVAQAAARIPSARTVVPDSTLHADVVIVGLGAGGSMVLHDLALQGVDVLGLEYGASYDPTAMTRREEQMLPHLLMDSGARATQDMAVGILQGKGVGGSTLHNTNLCKRLPRPLLEQWARDFGLDNLLSDTLTQDFDDVEALLGVHPVPDDAINENNRLIAKGVQALGWQGGRLSHNRQGCKQSGFCELGCPNNGKQNAAKVLVPAALDAGARVLTHARVVRILTRDNQAYGVRCEAVSDDGHTVLHTFEVHASQVILGASATGSAELALRSDLPDPYNLCGTNLHMHPGAFVAGVFDHPVRSWEGTPQAQDCTEFLSFDDPLKSAWIVSGAAHPGGGAGLMPGFGRAHGEIMTQYANVAVSIVMLHDHCSGHVRPRAPYGLSVHYALGRQEYKQLEVGIKAAARILLAAGAREVVIPLNPIRRATREADLQTWSWKDLGPFSPRMVAVHPMSTLWMGADPRASVVDPQGAHHQVRALWVADGSLFPTSIGGPPQIPIYTFGRHVARHVAHAL